MKIGFALSPELFKKFELKEILNKFEEIRDEVWFEIIELQFDKNFRLGEKYLSINDKKLHSFLPNVLKSYKFGWTIHDNYRIGKSNRRKLLKRVKMYDELTNLPLTLHLPTQPNIKKVERDGYYLRKRIEREIYVENNADGLFSNVQQLSSFVSKVRLDGIHLDIAHYLDSGNDELIDNFPIKYIHLSACSEDLKYLYPNNWKEVKEKLKTFGKTPRHLHLTDSSKSLKFLEKLLSTTQLSYIVLEISPKRLWILEEDIWKVYTQSLYKLCEILG